MLTERLAALRTAILNAELVVQAPDFNIRFVPLNDKVKRYLPPREFCGFVLLRGQIKYWPLIAGQEPPVAGRTTDFIIPDGGDPAATLVEQTGRFALEHTEPIQTMLQDLIRLCAPLGLAATPGLISFFDTRIGQLETIGTAPTLLVGISDTQNGK